MEDEYQLALTRFTATSSPEQIEELLRTDPVLRSPGMHMYLEAQEEMARQRGQTKIADAMQGIHNILDNMAPGIPAEVSAAPGTKVAAAIVAALLEAEQAVIATPIPYLIISDPFFLITGTLRQGLLKSQSEQLPSLQQLEMRAEAAAKTLDKHQRRQARDFLVTLETWLSAETWAESKQFLAGHKELLSSETTVVMNLLLRGAHLLGDTIVEEDVARHIDLLARIPTEGVDKAYEQAQIEEERAALRSSFRDNILRLWFGETERLSLGSGPSSAADIAERLNNIEDALRAPLDSRPNYDNGSSGIRWSQGILSAEDLQRACSLYLRVMQRGGTEVTYVEEGMLNLIAAQGEPSTLSFWQEVVAFGRPRDSFANRRRRLAFAALARIAILHNSEEAIQVLFSLSQHKNAALRSNAMYYLGQVYLFSNKPVPADVQADFDEAATSAADFETRFHARNIQRYCQLPVAIDIPDGAFVMKVDYKGPAYTRVEGVSRTIEIESTESMAGLAVAILDSVGFDMDHLYAFYLTNTEQDARFEIDSPDSLSGGYGAVDAMWGGGQSAAMIASDVTIGELGLRLRHKLTFEFDFGDGHVFAVTVVGIKPQAEEKTAYPRIVAKQGEDPEQYPGERDDYESEDEDDESEDDDQDEGSRAV